MFGAWGRGRTASVSELYLLGHGSLSCHFTYSHLYTKSVEWCNTSKKINTNHNAVMYLIACPVIRLGFLATLWIHTCLANICCQLSYENATLWWSLFILLSDNNSPGMPGIPSICFMKKMCQKMTKVSYINLFCLVRQYDWYLLHN